MASFNFELTFPEGSSGVSYATNYTFPWMTHALDTEAMVSTSTYSLLQHIEVAECNASPESCLHDAQNALHLMTVVERGQNDRSTNEILKCAKERLSQFNKKIRTEVLQKTIIE